jgi:S-formylglutathione hydrolase
MEIKSPYNMEIKSKVRCFDGDLIRFAHNSSITKTSMIATVYIPFSTEADSSTTKFSTLLYLSGLTCTDENVCIKGGPLFQVLSSLKMAFIAPDTSPRDANISGENESWDFGLGAGFYVDATQSPWSANYRMYSYILDELLPLIAIHFPKIDTNK